MALANKKSSYNILDGPSVADLIFAMFHANYSHSHNVDITIYAPENGPAVRNVKVTLQVNSVEREDGSGQSYNLTGYIVKMDGASFPISMSQFEAYFSTRTRKGRFHVQF